MGIFLVLRPRAEAEQRSLQGQAFGASASAKNPDVVVAHDPFGAEHLPAPRYGLTHPDGGERLGEGCMVVLQLSLGLQLPKRAIRHWQAPAGASQSILDYAWHPWSENEKDALLWILGWSRLEGDEINGIVEAKARWHGEPHSGAAPEKPGEDGFSRQEGRGQHPDKPDAGGLPGSSDR